MEKAVFTDTHTHLYIDEFDEDRDMVVRKAIESGVTRMYLPNLDITTVEPMTKLCEAYPENCFPMMGLHPSSVKEDYKDQLSKMEKLLGENKYAAIGEIGIDLYWTDFFKEQQKDAFRIQLEWGKQLDMPVVIHVRESFWEVFDILDRVNDDRLRGVFHSSTGNFFHADRAQTMGFMIGINGIVTFKNSGLDKVIIGVDPDNLLIETDSPYLTPNPYRASETKAHTFH